MKRKYIFYEDPGHAWLKVEKKELVELGIASKISHHSYMRDDFAYLEEDCDFSTFYNAKLSRGVKIEYNTKFASRESRIRSYQSYQIY